MKREMPWNVEPEFVVDEGECERNAGPVQRLNAGPERLEHRLPQVVRLRRVHVSLRGERFPTSSVTSPMSNMGRPTPAFSHVQIEGKAQRQ